MHMLMLSDRLSEFLYNFVDYELMSSFCVTV